MIFTFQLLFFLDKCCKKDPDFALEIIFDIFNENYTDDSILENLAAGPLEDLLSRNGPLVIDSIIKFSRENEIFKPVLLYVWRNSISAEVWERIQDELISFD
jgi:hypothetical protein